MKDYYAVLSVDRGASAQDVRRAYRSLARTYHPDANPDDAVAEETFKEINEAYQVLRHPMRRERYDIELGISRRPEFYAAPEPERGTHVATFRRGTPLQGMRVVRKYGQLFLQGGEEMAAVAVLEFDRLGQLDWADESERDWVLAKAAGRPVDPAGPAAAASAAGPRRTAGAGPGATDRAEADRATAAGEGPGAGPGPGAATPASAPPFYVNARARQLVEKARRAADRGRFDAALKLLQHAEPSARRGDAEVARGIADVARSMRVQVSGERRAECDALLAQVCVAGAVAEERGAGHGSRTRVRPLSWLRRRAAARG